MNGLGIQLIFSGSVSFLISIQSILVIPKRHMDVTLLC